MTFKEMLGQEFGFYGVDGNSFKLGKMAFKAVKRVEDRYHSYLRSVEMREPSGLNFSHRAMAKVRVVKVVEKTDDGDFDGYNLVDVSDGHVWLRLGTDFWDNGYVPVFNFKYTPKAP